MSASLIYLLIGGAALYWVFFMGGKDQIMGMIDQVTGGSGGSIFNSSQTSTGKNSWTDENGNQFNIDNDVRTANNVSGGAGSAAQIQSNVQNMLKKMGVNNGSGQSISRTRQIDTTGKARQTQTHKQTARVNYASLVRMSI